MPNSPPALAPSGVTWAQLQSLGFHGTIAQVAQANGLGSALVSRIKSSDTIARAVHAYTALLDQFLAGAPIASKELTTRLNDLATIFRSLSQTTDEINALIAANPGTIRDVIAPANSGTGPSVRQGRNWP